VIATEQEGVTGPTEPVLLWHQNNTSSDTTCPNCRTTNSRSARFCRSCGFNLSVPMFAARSRSRHSRSLLWLIPTVIVLVAGATVGAYLMTGATRGSVSQLAQPTPTTPDYEIQIRNRINSLFQDIGHERLNAHAHFAPSVKQYISMKQTNPSAINENLRKYSYPEYRFHRPKVRKESFRMIDATPGAYRAEFIQEGTCYRESKRKAWQIVVWVEAQFNYNYKITSWVEKEVIKSGPLVQHRVNSSNVSTLQAPVPVSSTQVTLLNMTPIKATSIGENSTSTSEGTGRMQQHTKPLAHDKSNS